MGTVNVPLDKGTDPANVEVITEDQRPLPFTIEGDSELRFFAGAPGTVRVLTGDRETVYSLTLPDAGDAVWRPPQNVRRGIPRAFGAEASVTDFWPWLALLGGLGTTDRLAAVRAQPGVSAARREGGRTNANRLEESVMTFDRAWVLAIAWLPLAWMVFEWRRTSRRSALVLKALSLAAILFALAEPRLSVSETKVAVAVLVDTSASVSSTDLDRASHIADSIASERGRHWMRVIPFARSTRSLDRSEEPKAVESAADRGRSGPRDRSRSRDS